MRAVSDGGVSPRGDASRTQLLRVRGRSVAWVPPLLLLVGIVSVDFRTSADFRILSWIVLVPGIAAAICGVWGTAAFAVLAPVTYIAADAVLPHEYQAGLPDLVLAALGGALATLACVVRVRGERRVLHMEDVAATIRSTVLRPLPPGWGGLEHAAVYLAADSEARVGGDFYDIQTGLHGTRVILGDVQGKGLGAVEVAAALLGTFREAAYHEPDLTTIAARLEVRMQRHIRMRKALGREDGDRFATAVLIGFPETAPAPPAPPVPGAGAGVEAGDGVGGGAVARGGGEAGAGGGAGAGAAAGTGGGTGTGGGPGTGTGTGAGAGAVGGAIEALVLGHDTPLVVGPGGVRRLPPGHGLPVGMGELDPAGTAPPVLHATLAPGETLLMTTDGVTEARDGDGAFYPLTADVAGAVAADPGLARPRRLVAFVRERTLRHCGGHLTDDTTVFAVRRADPDGGIGDGNGRLRR